MSTSKLQRQVSALLSTHLGQYAIRENTRPEWLDGLELDFCIEELRVGIEVQGQQHYAYTPHFHKNYTDFLASQERDRRKADLCKHVDVALYYVEDGREILPLVEQLAEIELPTVIHPRCVFNVQELGRIKRKTAQDHIDALAKKRQKGTNRLTGLVGQIKGILKTKGTCGHTRHLAEKAQRLAKRYGVRPTSKQQRTLKKAGG